MKLTPAMSPRKVIIIACLMPAVMILTAPARAQGGSTIQFCLAGDIMLGRGVKRMSDKYGAGYPFAATCSLTAGADLAAGNLESPLTTAPYLTASPWKFTGDTLEAALALKQAGFDHLSLANNHMADCGRAGLLETERWLDSAGINHAGRSNCDTAAFDSLSAADDSAAAAYAGSLLCLPSYLTVNGVRVGFLSFCQPYLLKIAKGHGAELVARADSATVARSIAAIRDSCDLIVASFHWGQEYQDQPNWEQKKLGRLAIDCGARIVHGHHPHVLQGVEFYKEGLIAYSLGNFIFDQRHTMPRQSALLFVRVTNDSLAQVSLVPLAIAHNRPTPVSSQTATGINKRMIGLCRKLGTAAKAVNESLLLTPLNLEPAK